MRSLISSWRLRSTSSSSRSIVSFVRAATKARRFSRLASRTFFVSATAASMMSRTLSRWVSVGSISYSMTSIFLSTNRPPQCLWEWGAALQVVPPMTTARRPAMPMRIRCP